MIIGVQKIVAETVFGLWKKAICARILGQLRIMKLYRLGRTLLLSKNRKGRHML